MKKAIFIISGCLILIIAAFTLTRQPAASKEIGSGKKAPEFSLKDINGMERKLSDFKGRVVIIDFWATRCQPCRDEIPHFIDLYDQYKGRGLEIIGIALDLDAKKVYTFSRENKINYTILLGDEEVSDLYGGIAFIPTTFIVDKDGNIRKKYTGYNEKEVFEKDIKELL